MISDVLSDALDRIEEYQSAFECYSDFAKEISVVVQVMDALRMYFDVPSELGLESAKKGLKAAIAQTDLSAINEAERVLYCELERLRRIRVLTDQDDEEIDLRRRRKTTSKIGSLSRQTGRFS